MILPGGETEREVARLRSSYERAVPEGGWWTDVTWEQSAWMDAVWLDAASAYASTPTGREHLLSQQREARAADQDAAAARLGAALRRGELRRETVEAEQQERRRRELDPRPRSLQPAEAVEVGERFGAGPGQVRRDHVISHVLAALATVDGATHRDSPLVFIGGTALARTLLPTLRLSEDIDLLTRTPRRPMAVEIERVLRHALRRTHGVLTWAGPRLDEVGDAEAAVAVLGDVVHAPRPVGPSGLAFSPPPDGVWNTALAHQGRVRVTAAEAVREVRETWERATRLA